MHYTAINCLRCESVMEDGFIIDRADYNTINTWVEGEPVKSFWSGIKTKGKEQYAVRTLRCTNCGYLESYATEEIADSFFS